MASLPEPSIHTGNFLSDLSYPNSMHVPLRELHQHDTDWRPEQAEVRALEQARGDHSRMALGRAPEDLDLHVLDPYTGNGIK